MRISRLRFAFLLSTSCLTTAACSTLLITSSDGTTTSSTASATGSGAATGNTTVSGTGTGGAPYINQGTGCMTSYQCSCTCNGQAVPPFFSFDFCPQGQPCGDGGTAAGDAATNPVFESCTGVPQGCFI